MNIYDKKGIPITVGDVLKVYHYSTGNAKKHHHFMYKWVLKKESITITNGPNEGTEREFFTISHLHDPENPYKEKYIIIANETVHDEIEIIQGYGGVGCRFTERKK